MVDLLRGRGRRITLVALAFALAGALAFGLVSRQGGERPRDDLAGATPATAVIAASTAPSESPAGSPASSASPSPAATPIESPLGAAAAATGNPDPPQASSAPLARPTAPPATPTPPPQEGSWRVEGVVLDAQGNPVKGVCVAVGPHGCQAVNPRTDDRGVYWVDLPQVTVNWDFHFIKAGYATADRRITPTGPILLNVQLRG